jgi:hypothetical protein
LNQPDTDDMKSKTAGTLNVDQTRSGGKVIDEWRFISPFKGQDAPKLSAKISIHKSDHAGLTFEAHSDSIPRPIVDTDINRLRQKVDDALRHQHDMLTGVTWVEWLEVEVRGRRSTRPGSDTVEADLRITYRVLKRGVHPDTGDAYFINLNGIAMPFPSAKQAGEPDPDVDPNESESLQDVHLFRGLSRARDLECEYSYLPATPENISALEDLIGRLQSLRDALSTFLRQDTVHASLAGLAGAVPSLPAPL